MSSDELKEANQRTVGSVPAGQRMEYSCCRDSAASIPLALSRNFSGIVLVCAHMSTVVVISTKDGAIQS